MIVDTHCHLDHFAEEEMVGLIGRAKQKGVHKMITICTDIEKFEVLLDRSMMFSDTVYASVGQHPCNVNEMTSKAKLSEIIEYNRSKIVAIGETGLDYYRSQDVCVIEAQKRSFTSHIEVAAEYDLPLVIHSRGSDIDVADMLESAFKSLGSRGVIHCFTGSRVFMERMVSIGFYISISGIATFKSATELQGIIKHIPIDRILVETDSPYLAPMPHRGKRNEPSFVVDTANFVANLIGMDCEHLYHHTTQNACRLFAIGAMN